MMYDLSPIERLVLDTFLAKKQVSKMLSNGGQFALVFGPSVGIGMPVKVTVRGTDGVEVSKELTDYTSW